jgi:hypothetical protein
LNYVLRDIFLYLICIKDTPGEEKPVNNDYSGDGNQTPVHDEPPVDSSWDAKPRTEPEVSEKQPESQPSETAPVENKSVENKPVDSKPTDNLPVEKKPFDLPVMPQVDLPVTPHVEKPSIEPVKNSEVQEPVRNDPEPVRHEPEPVRNEPEPDRIMEPIVEKIPEQNGPTEPPQVQSTNFENISPTAKHDIQPAVTES